MDRGDFTIISLRDGIGDKDSALVFSFRGLVGPERDSAQGELGKAVLDDTVLDEPLEMVSIQPIRVMGSRPR